jgi:hypothetical protein
MPRINVYVKDKQEIDDLVNAIRAHMYSRTGISLSKSNVIILSLRSYLDKLEKQVKGGGAA